MCAGSHAVSAAQTRKSAPLRLRMARQPHRPLLPGFWPRTSTLYQDPKRGCLQGTEASARFAERTQNHTCTHTAAELRKIGVNVFGMASRKESLILQIKASSARAAKRPNHVSKRANGHSLVVFL